MKRGRRPGALENTARISASLAIGVGEIRSVADQPTGYRVFARAVDAIASSADGAKLVAGGLFTQVYTSTDSGTTWFPREGVRDWRVVVSSADGNRLATGVHNGGRIYTSSDSGVTWTPRESARFPDQGLTAGKVCAAIESLSQPS